MMAPHLTVLDPDELFEFVVECTASSPAPALATCDASLKLLGQAVLEMGR